MKRHNTRNALVLLLAALMLMASAATGATAALMITGKQIKNNSVSGKDIKNNSLKSKDVKNRSLTVRDFSRAAKRRLRGNIGPAGSIGPAGPRGETGPAGAQGLPGLPGLPGLSGFEVVSKSVPMGLVPGMPTEVAAACPAGKKAVAATGGFAMPMAGLLSQVTRVSDTQFKAVGVPSMPGLDSTLSLDVVCATIPS